MKIIITERNKIAQALKTIARQCMIADAQTLLAVVRKHPAYYLDLVDCTVNDVAVLFDTSYTGTRIVNIEVDVTPPPGTDSNEIHSFLFRGLYGKCVVVWATSSRKAVEFMKANRLRYQAMQRIHLVGTPPPQAASPCGEDRPEVLSQVPALATIMTTVEAAIDE